MKGKANPSANHPPPPPAKTQKLMDKAEENARKKLTEKEGRGKDKEKETKCDGIRNIFGSCIKAANKTSVFNKVLQAIILRCSVETNTFQEQYMDCEVIYHINKLI